MEMAEQPSRRRAALKRNSGMKSSVSQPLGLPPPDHRRDFGIRIGSRIGGCGLQLLRFVLIDTDRVKTFIGIDGDDPEFLVDCIFADP